MVKDCRKAYWANNRVLGVAVLVQLAACTSLADEGELGAPAEAPASMNGTEAGSDTLGLPGNGGSFNPGSPAVPSLGAPEGPPASGSMDLEPASEVLAPEAEPLEPPAPVPRADAGPPTPPPGPGDCPGGASLGGRCYRAATAPLPWNEARAACLASGGDLVSIGSAEEDALVGGLVNGSVWIGASDQQVDNLFQWVDGSPVSFTNWGPGQPDAFPGQDCVQKREEPAEPWYDQPCSSVLSYVCESLILS